jgi:hypothetical protein
MKHVSIRQAMQYVADNPETPDDNLIALPVHELVARTLFEIANSPTQQNKRSMKDANIARDIILKRLVGRRRAGSHPATKQKTVIEFEDLTGGAIEA